MTTDTGSPPLVVRHLNKRFGAIEAISNVSISVSVGQIVGLIGPNGAGKTTLLECVAGVLSSGGEVCWNDRPLAPRERRTVIFYLPDGIAVYPSQSVRQVLAFFSRVYRCDRDFVARVIAALELEPLLTRRCGQLSKGARRRVELAIGLLTPHPVLLVDEPFDGLDLRQTRQAMEILTLEASRGRGLLLSIHQLAEAERACDRLVLLNEGRVVAEGTLRELRERSSLPQASLEEVFLALS